MWKRITAIGLSLLLGCVVLTPVHAEEAATGVTSTAKAYVLMEANTGTVIQQENGDEQLPVAGLVKIMSYLLFYEALDNKTVQPTDMVTISEEAAKKGGTRVFLDAGTSYSFETLLKPAVMCSANDAVTALAEHLAGSEAAFAQMMNDRAQEMGLQCSFQDATGLDASSHMSASDCAIIASELSKHAGFFKYSAIWMDTFVHESGRETEMANSNKLVKSEGYDGMATGSTADSGYHLIASYKNGSARYICAVLGDKKTDDRFTFAKGSIGYAAGIYSVKQVAKAGAKVKSVEIENGSAKEVDLYATQDLALLLKKGEEANVSKRIDLPETLIAPLTAGQVVGKLVVTLPNGEEKAVDLAVKDEVSEMTFSSCMGRIIRNWLRLA